MRQPFAPSALALGKSPPVIRMFLDTQVRTTVRYPRLANETVKPSDPLAAASIGCDILTAGLNFRIAMAGAPLPTVCEAQGNPVVVRLTLAAAAARSPTVVYAADRTTGNLPRLRARPWYHPVPDR